MDRPQRSVFIPPHDEVGIGLEAQVQELTAVEGVEIEEIDESLEDGAAIIVPNSYNERSSYEVKKFNIFGEEESDEDDNFDNDDANDPDFHIGGPLPKVKRPPRKVEALDSLEVEQCSICGTTVADLALHIVNMHSAPPAPKEVTSVKLDPTVAKPTRPKPVRSDIVPPPEIPSPAMLALMPRKRAYCKGKYQQIKPVLRYPCDACSHVSKTTDQLKKHMIVVHNGHKNTSWMFCGDCEYATRVEEELVTHVKHHQLFKILGDEDEEEIMIEPKPKKAKSMTGLGNYSSVAMNCGDCSFQTHYEDELFEHLKEHIRQDANIHEDTAEEIQMKKEEIEASVETKTIYEEDGALHCGLCSFSSKNKKNMLRHSNVAHDLVINDKDYHGGTTIAVKQTAFHCTLCKFRGRNKEELNAHKRRTIHNKYGGVTAVDPIAEAEERKARIRNNCLQ